VSTLRIRLPELPLPALHAIERELRRLVVGETRKPALRVGRHPGPLALDALGDQGDALGVHKPSLDRAQSVPKHLEAQSRGQAVRRPGVREQSHFAAPPDIARLTPSNVWGVGYRLLADVLPERRTA
jgi:hypothetical protein